MNISLLQLTEGAKQARGLTVVIDVFRAFTVEAFLMANHAAKIIPVADISTAFALREADPNVILCGEREGIMVEGFDYGNSPSQIEHGDFSGKTVVHTTSAGTQGIANARYADQIIGGSLVCAKAIARYIQMQNPEQVCLVCMGLSGTQPTDEDTLCGEYIKSLLEGNPLPDLEQRLYNLRFTDGAKFFDEKQSAVFPRRDFDLCVQADRFDFILRLNRELGCMERIDVPVDL